ncbi:HNH endonuclease [Micromonospora sp. URMC 107]|uniref:HNH endonuclease n=1 Tax=Micromonospora sp. URMC 107 TaxID=3423418 RepID=UPI003F1A39B5
MALPRRDTARGRVRRADRDRRPHGPGPGHRPERLGAVVCAVHSAACRYPGAIRQPWGIAMTWEGSDRRARLPSNWGTIRRRILRRDGYKCRQVFSTGERCGAPANQVDHIERGDDHRPDNLQALCAYCHGVKTAGEAVEARRASPRPTRARPAERHPGAL